MPPLDEEIMGSESSAEPELDEQVDGQPPEQPDAAASSTATGEENGDDLLNVVRDAVTDSRKAPDEASPAEGEEDGQTAEVEPPKEQDNENYSDVPFNKHPRFQQLVREKNAYKQDAEAFRNVQGFLDNAGLDANEASEGLVIMGLMKTNPVEAWKRLKPTVQKLLVAAGEVLPEDLQRMVQEGKMDQAAALEVSRARAGVTATQAQMTFEQQRMQRQQQTQAVQARTSAATDWEARRRRNDPNFEAKMVPLQKEILFLQQTEGRPKTPQGVLEQLERAYKAVNEQIRPAAPAPAARKPAVKPVTGGQVAGNQRPASSSTLDIIKANRRAP